MWASLPPYENCTLENQKGWSEGKEKEEDVREACAPSTRNI